MYVRRKVYSDLEGEFVPVNEVETENLYSVTMSEDELRLFAEVAEEVEKKGLGTGAKVGIGVGAGAAGAAGLTVGGIKLGKLGKKVRAESLEKAREIGDKAFESGMTDAMRKDMDSLYKKAAKLKPVEKMGDSLSKYVNTAKEYLGEHASKEGVQALAKKLRDNKFGLSLLKKIAKK